MSATVFLAVDGSPSADRALALLEGYAGERGRIDVVALNVQERPVALWPEAVALLPEIEPALLATGRKIAEAAAARLAAAGLHAEAAARLGFPAATIAREAQARKAALVVTGTRGHGAVHGLALGSVAMRVAHASAVPVCIVQPAARLPAGLGKTLRVMLAIDGSEPGLRAAAALASWRRWLGELDVQVLYVQQPLAYLETVLPPHDDVMRQWSTRSGEEATQPARAALEKAGIRPHLHLSLGDPAVEIAHMAGETGCEMLVLGTRGRGAMHHALVGSVALKVAARAEVPVVLVK